MADLSNSSAKKVNFRIKKGDTFRRVLKFEKADETPIDLTGSTIKMDIREDADSTPIKELTIGSGLSIQGDDTNEVLINTLADFDAGRYIYDLQVTFTTGIIKTYLTGAIINDEDYTD